MQTQSQVAQSGGLGILALVGLVGSAGLCCCDWYTSFMCMKSIFTNQQSPAAFWFPFFLSSLTIGSLALR